MSSVREIIKSKKGFYVGDPCYVLTSKDYQSILPEGGFLEGSFIYKDNKFAAARTFYGDGTYKDNYKNIYPVDSGIISILPYELCTGEHIKSLPTVGAFFEGTKAYVTFVDGEFYIDINSGRKISINTHIQYY